MPLLSRRRLGRLAPLGALLWATSGCSIGYELLSDESPVMASGGDAAGGSLGTGSAGTTGSGAGAGDGAGGTPEPSGGTGGSGGSATAPGVCGDGVTNATAGEDCDDGGESASCNADCSASTCGDDVLNSTSGEECEPGLVTDCRVDCSFAPRHYLVHRYSFDGTGTTLVDSVGGADGTVVGTTLDESGQMVLAGAGSGQYGNLPNGIISALTNATFEFWLHWSGGVQWQRVFEFGSTVEGEDVVGNGLTYLVLIPATFDGTNYSLRLAFTNNGNPATTEIDMPRTLPTNPGTHLVIVVDDDNDELRAYVDGSLVGRGAFTMSLSDLDDVNNWLGKSQWINDPDFEGSFDEFRIYDGVLNAQEIADSLEAGPDF